MLTYQPIATLIILVDVQIRKDGDGIIVLSCLDVTSELVHRLDRVGLQEVFIVQVVKQNIKSLLSIGNVLLVLGWRASLDTLHLCLEDFVDWA